MAADVDQERARASGLFGRRAERAAVLDVFEPKGPCLVTMTGIPGIGKSSLLRACVRAGIERGARAQLIDCRTVEPTVHSFQRALACPGREGLDGGPRVVCLDHYDHFFLMDAWLREWFLRESERGLRLVLAGRQAPSLGWSLAGTRSLTIPLDVLDEKSALEFLADAGMDTQSASRILRITKGHPLAMRLALGAKPADSPQELETLALPEVVHRLTAYFLEDVRTPELREALEAASSVRRVTRPLLDAMLARSTGAELYEALAALPLVDVRSDGLSLHPTVHGAVERWLRAADPARFADYRRRAWRALELEVSRVPVSDLWRYTADVIYLIEDPIVREAFFSSALRAYSLEPATPRDRAAVLEITQAHDGASERESVSRWMDLLPDAFRVARDARGDVQGFYCLFDAHQAPAEAAAHDPLVRAWMEDVPRKLRGQRRVLFLRRWLSREHGDRPSAVQAACWLDVKRAYLESRPLLRRVYLAVQDLAPFAQAATKLGFTPVCMGAHASFASAMLDFGPGSVDAWLGRLLRAELGIAENAALDEDSHGLTLGNTTLPLTPRELAFMRILVEAHGAVVGRDELLRQAWSGGHAVGSNVVDVLVRGLRRKLGPRSDALQTVRGAGYCWKP
jgi:hypothetical protein